MLETDRLLLRPAILSDASLLFDLNSDPDVVRYTGEGAFHDLMEAEKVVRDRLMAHYSQYRMGRFMTFLKDGTFIGWCGLRFFPETQEIDLGYRFKKKFWGQGLATEASIVCLKYGFGELGLKRIMATAMPDNIGSIKVMQKLGMTFRGYGKDPCESLAMIKYDITAQEFNR